MARKRKMEIVITEAKPDLGGGIAWPTSLRDCDAVNYRMIFQVPVDFFKYLDEDEFVRTAAEAAENHARILYRKAKAQ